MKQLLQILLAILFLGIGTSFFPDLAFSEESYLLRNQFQENQTAYLIMNSTVITVTTEDEKQHRVEQGLKTVMSYNTIMIDPQKRATIKIGIEQLAITGRTPVDLKKMLQIENEKITLKINPLGEVYEFTPPPSLSTPNTQGQTTSQQYPWLKFPERAVQVGDSWTDQRTLPYPGASKPIISYTTYTLQETAQQNDQTIAVISTNTQIQADDVTVDPVAQGEGVANLQLKYTFKEFQSRGKGSIRFNMDTGQIVSFHSESDLLMDLAVDAGVGQENFPNTFIQKSKVETTGYYSSEKPD